MIVVEPSAVVDRIRPDTLSDSARLPLSLVRARLLFAMNTIFNGRITRSTTVYDYAGVWTRRSGGVDWKAVVRNADVVCRPGGSLDDTLTDSEIRAVIRQLVALSVDEATGGAI